MPIYEYRCTSCDAALEKLQKISDQPLTDCPACGKATLQKLVSASSFRLKGSGWYETDFKNSNKKAAGGADSKAAPGNSSDGNASGAGAASDSANASGKSASDSTASSGSKGPDTSVA